MRPLAILATVFLLVSPLAAQAPPAGRGAPPPAPRESAAVDLTGYWVSVIVEDWKWRMVTPKKGVFEGVPLNAEGRKVGESWDPARDEAAGQQCKAYGAANIMRLPGRLHVTWEDASTLKIETDAGTQTRLLRFGAARPGRRAYRARAFGRVVDSGTRRTGTRWRRPATGRQPEGGDDEPDSRLRSQERRATQRERGRDGVLRREHLAQR